MTNLIVSCHVSVSSILSKQVGVIPVLSDPTVNHESDLVTPMQKLKVNDIVVNTT